MKLDEERLLDFLIFDKKTSSWVLNITDLISVFGSNSHSDYYENCYVGLTPPKEVHGILRYCPENLVDSCPPGWADVQVKTQCESYVSYVCNLVDERVYQNYYCGYCNHNGTFNSLVCVGDPTVRSTQPPADFSLLFDWHSLTKRSICGDETEKYDPLSRNCRKLFDVYEGESVL